MGKPDPTDVHVGNRVRQARISAGMSQTKLGDGIDITFQQVQKYEKGRNRIGASRLSKIAEVVGKPVSWFFDGIPAQGDFIRGPATADPMQEMASTRDGQRLAKAFNKISNGASRQAIVRIVEAVANIDPEAVRSAA